MSGSQWSFHALGPNIGVIFREKTLHMRCEMSARDVGLFFPIDLGVYSGTRMALFKDDGVVSGRTALDIG